LAFGGEQGLEINFFENKPLFSLDKIAIDHYLPWSLVTHDSGTYAIEQKSK
jgi:hypothetical protein